MMDHEGKIAVISGAAQGIGRALALELARRRCRLAIVDIDADALRSVAAEIAGSGAYVLAVPADVSQSAEVERLARSVEGRFGGVDLLFNNAGVAGGRPVWEYTDQDWQWQLGVNLLSAAYAIREFVPLMLKQHSESHIINTASAAGLISAPGMAAYNASKHALVSLSETLQHELRGRDANIWVSVVCPAWVRTNIWDSERHRPRNYRTDAGGRAVPPMIPSPSFRKLLESSGLLPHDVAVQILDGVAARQFYILPSRRTAGMFLKRAEILKQRQAAFNPLEPT